MAEGEFQLIHRYFKKNLPHQDVVIGIGDDAAELALPANEHLVVTMDTLISGVHFPIDTAPADIAYKAIAVNLSDLAAMGAKPRWLTLSLALPNTCKDWLAEFSEEFHQQCRRYQVSLVGGDTCRSPHLVVSITAHGSISARQALTRSGAQVGDKVYVTGTIGDAAAGLDVIQNFRKSASKNNSATNTNSAQISSPQHNLIERLNRPSARVEFGQQLVGIANAAIDISDGLISDLNHLLTSSQCGAIVNVDNLPLSSALSESYPQEKAIAFALAGGDDYELCFTVPPKQQKKLETLIASASCPVTCIGVVSPEQNLRLEKRGKPWQFNGRGYEHFNDE